MFSDHGQSVAMQCLSCQKFFDLKVQSVASQCPSCSKRHKFESYETGNVEDHYSGHCEHSDGYADGNGNDLLHGHAEVRR